MSAEPLAALRDDPESCPRVPASYRDNRPVGLNEVGGHPDGFGVSADEFHAQEAAGTEARAW